MIHSKKNRHIVLVVEDDPNVVKELAERLQSLGHQMVAVPSQEEAMALLDAGEFCCVLLDLQILLDANGNMPRIEYGKTLLRIIRDRFPARNKADHHCLQIVVMSGFAKEMVDAVWCLQYGANDFIAKPLNGQDSVFVEKIENCFRRSHRNTHQDCFMVMATARQKQDEDASQSTGTHSKVQLSIIGENHGKRTNIVVNGRVFNLPDFKLILLMKLVAARVMNGHGWVHKVDLGSTDTAGFKGISNLNSTLQMFLPNGLVFYENDKQGRYRINPAIEVAQIDHEQLAQHRLKEIVMLSSRIRSVR
ncbi:MAG: response regulator [Magnetococcales bacterium]|nr:response regulator [Magnetococcales bacterium]